MRLDAGWVTVLDSTIDSVTIFRSGARITRKAILIRSPTGFPKRVSIAGLPLSLIDGSIRARIYTRNTSSDTTHTKDGAKGRLGTPSATDVRIALGVERTSEELPNAQDNDLIAATEAVAVQQSLRDQIQRELDRLSQLELQGRVSDVVSGTDNAGIGRMPSSPVKGRLTLLSQRQQSWRVLAAELSAAQAELDARQRHLRIVSEQHAKATDAKEPKQHELRKTAHISIVGGTTESAVLALDYRVSGACWAPAYVARISDHGKHVRLGTRAIVAQQTGEDWSGVSLSLVTAAADTLTTLPTLRSLRLGRKQSIESTGWRPPPSGTAELFEDYLQAYSPPAKAVPPPAMAAMAANDFDDELTTPGVFAGGAVAAGAVTVGDLHEEMSTPPPAPSPVPLPVFAPEEIGMQSAAFALATSAKSGRPRSSRRRAAKTANTTRKKTVMSAGSSVVQTASESSPEEGTSLSLGEELLDYQSLRMSDPDSLQRGLLVADDLETRYLGDLASGGWRVSYSLNAALRRAERARTQAMTQLKGVDLPSSESFDYSYVATSRVSVPSDGESHSVALSAAEGDCSIHYQVCPQKSSDVFRIARMSNPLDAPLLPGPIDVYLDSAFLLSSAIAFTPPSGMMRFGLGVEQAIRVVRNTSFRDDSAGLLRGSRQLGHHLRIEVQNHLDQSVELEIRERIPVAREDEDDILVEIGQVIPAWVAFEPGIDEPNHSRLKGGYRWLQQLEPGAKHEFKASYTIRIPGKFELVGGNRRDK